MPEICRFYGITIRMYFADHDPPHFHAFYGEHEAIIDLATLAVLAGSLPGGRWAWWWNGRHAIRTPC